MKTFTEICLVYMFEKLGKYCLAFTKRFVYNYDDDCGLIKVYDLKRQDFIKLHLVSKIKKYPFAGESYTKPISYKNYILFKGKVLVCFR